LECFKNYINIIMYIILQFDLLYLMYLRFIRIGIQNTFIHFFLLLHITLQIHSSVHLACFHVLHYYDTSSTVINVTLGISVSFLKVHTKKKNRKFYWIVPTCSPKATENTHLSALCERLHTAPQ
jgi:hypothetical protein